MPCKVPRSYNILSISVHAIVINRVFANECYLVLRAKQQIMIKNEGDDPGRYRATAD